MLEELGYRDAELLEVEEEFVLNNNIEFKTFMAKVVPMDKYKSATWDVDGSIVPITYEKPPVYFEYVKDEPPNIAELVATWWHGGGLWQDMEWRDIYKINFTDEERYRANSIILTLISDGWG